jgi:hypothetical protein
MMVRCAAHRRLPPRRRRGHDHWRGERGDSVEDTLGVSGLRALVERSCPRPATRTREPSFAWVWDTVSGVERGADVDHEGTDVGEALEPLERVDQGVDQPARIPPCLEPKKGNDFGSYVRMVGQ